MYDLTYEVKRLAERNRDGSYATQADRKRMLMLLANQLVAMGYQQLHATELKGRHINRLLALWRTQALSHATIRNRLAVLRWWEDKIGKHGLLPRSNSAFQLEPRQEVSPQSKACTLPDEALSHIHDPYVQMSLTLQQWFGFRREEAIKIRPWQADEGQQVRLQGSWCKGGRERTQQLVFPEQRIVLDAAKALVCQREASLIPAHLSYIQQRRRYEYWTHKVGLSKLHGLRHAYFQRRYAHLTGFPCPHQGGPSREELTPAQQVLDAEARVVIAEEAGHSRLPIVATYIGV